jgi:hypothetical protein
MQLNLLRASVHSRLIKEDLFETRRLRRHLRLSLNPPSPLLLLCVLVLLSKCMLRTVLYAVPV